MQENKYSYLETEMHNGYYRMEEADYALMDAYIDRYKAFLDHSRTERTTITNTIALAEAKGFRPYVEGMDLKPGDRVYFPNHDRSMCLAVIGSKSLEEGFAIVASHVDSPRLDLRPRPLFEKNEMAFFRTHYYGWVRKYQWVALPLMLTGVVFLRDGSKVTVTIGEGNEEPKLVITDLLPHVSREQNKLPLAEAHTGEQMNILVGSVPLADAEKGKAVKLQVLKALNEKYGITEDDFITAELEAVPALPVSDVGLDRSLIGAYGHDDRVCAYAALDALFDLEIPGRTAVVILADKEEIGNRGVSGMRSGAFDYFLGMLCKSQGVELAKSYHKSFCLSADVTSAYDPNYADCFEEQNCAHLNRGIAICKYTGSEGKENASDATAETMAYACKLFNDHKVLWQSSEMSVVDLGGGGTVARELADRGIETLDAGVPVLSMHAPWETVSKLDCYMTMKACKVLFEE
ncbi:MAG: aminopeptidase [Oscillospiraceae bacterium]|nr:aminopeptidase [Oscillospiraceae bacterium]